MPIKSPYEGHRATRSHLLRCQVTEANKIKAEGKKCSYSNPAAVRMTMFAESQAYRPQRRQFPDHPNKTTQLQLR